MRLIAIVVLLAGCASVPEVPPLRSSPPRVFKAADPGREGTESCTLMIVLPEGTSPMAAEIATLAGGRELERRLVSAQGLEGMTIRSGPRAAIRLQVRRPAADAFDAVRGTVTFATGARGSFHVPVTGYVPQTKLIFPFRGKGLISAGAVNDGGHRNNSGQFALDVLALNDDYGPMICAEDKNECSAGFGRREIVAPADGVVVKAWNDIPDNPSWEEADRARFTRSDGTVVDTGNSVVLDHGNGEFSVIAHMQQGSVVVTEGQRVRQGDKLGLLGNSGESYGPHLHYQLQDGPDQLRASGLPIRFENGPSRLVRGAYFSAK